MNDQSLVDAYLNEFKGNIFEYLIGSKLARKFNIESDYIQNISSQFKQKLSSYESFIRTNKPQLISSLDKYSNSLLEELDSELPSNIKNIYLCGKLAKASHDNRFEEADLLIIGDKHLPISLKLSKYQSYVNTKSAGVKSFLSNYFDLFESASDQKILNELVDIEFINMSHRIHELNELDFKENYDEWVSLGKTQLPGKLNQQESDVLKSFYFKIISYIHKCLMSYYKHDSYKFLECLWPLLGYGKEDIMQVICFHHKEKDELKDIYIGKKLEINVVSIDDKLANNSFFNIELEDRILQIRIKPMNKFTNTSLKINCSVKYLS